MQGHYAAPLWVGGPPSWGTPATPYYLADAGNKLKNGNFSKVRSKEARGQTPGWASFVERLNQATVIGKTCIKVQIADLVTERGGADKSLFLQSRLKVSMPHIWVSMTRIGNQKKKKISIWICGMTLSLTFSEDDFNRCRNGFINGNNSPLSNGFSYPQLSTDRRHQGSHRRHPSVFPPAPSVCFAGSWDPARILQEARAGILGATHFSKHGGRRVCQTSCCVQLGTPRSVSIPAKENTGEADERQIKRETK